MDIRSKLPERKRTNRAELDDEISSVLEEMARLHADTPEYTRMAENLERLCRAKAEEPAKHQHLPQIIGILGSVGCLVLVMNYEKTDILTTKALQFLPRNRG